MALDETTFVGLGQNTNSDAPKSYAYRTTDTWATVLASGYFNNKYLDLNVGDVIIAHVDTDGTPDHGQLVVTDITSGVVQTNGLRYGEFGGWMTQRLDVSAANSAVFYLPVSGRVETLVTVIDTVLTTADAVLTASIGNAGSFTNITGGTITVTQSGSAIGDIDSATITAANTATGGQLLKVTSDGGPDAGVVTLHVGYIPLVTE